MIRALKKYFLIYLGLGLLGCSLVTTVTFLHVFFFYSFIVLFILSCGGVVLFILVWSCFIIIFWHNVLNISVVTWLAWLWYILMI